MKIVEYPMRLSVLLLALFVSSLHAAGVNFPEGYAVDGYDLVSYFNGGPQKGLAKHTVIHDGKFYAFLSAENASTFKADTDRYLPQYGGNCSYGMVFGMKSSIDPLIYEIVDEKIYFMINAGTQQRWERRPHHYIEVGQQNWQMISELH